ncbi:MAG TPA: phosphatidate cytidylyltransferase [Hyphomicrobiaceae bacterium]|jgi:phosphatidate cytidylyltransferase|nr:phosphatidate cytidylyltransferase [Hyphomicrobiaceae bacterium]
MSEDNSAATRASPGGWLARLGPDFRVRLLSGLALAAVAALFTLSGLAAFAILVAAGAMLVAWEWCRLVYGRDAGVIAGVCLGTALIAAGLAYFEQIALALMALCIGAILTTLLSLGRNSVFSALGVFYAGLPAVSLIWLRSDTLGLRAVIFVIVMAVVADTAAFAAGRLIGGPRLWPRLSPKKTWAGLIGAVVACGVAGLIFSQAVPGGSPARLMATGAVLALVAQAGDLAESALKRRFGAKDTGTLIPGHGGVMDRVDGLIAVASAAGLAALVIDVHAPASALLLWS